MTDCIQVFCACASLDEADRIAKTLVEKRLAACVQRSGPVTSTYHWQGKIETSEEYLCIIKSTATNYAKLEAEIKRLHSYSVPEIIAVPITQANPDYLNWLATESAP